MITDAFRLDDKVALITGASKGIGAGIATAFAEMGANVALVARSEDELQSVADAVSAHGVTTLPLACDITDDNALSGALDAVRAQFGRLDILVNNAGGPGKGYGSLEQVDRARFDHTLEINLSSAYSLTHLALPLLREAQHATIVNISSALAWMVDRNFAAYGAAKAGLEQMTRILAYELAPDIRVNAVSPGAIVTPSTAFITENPDMLESTVRWIPQGRMGQPEDIALAALYLASPASGFVSGKVLEVDGGMAALPGSAIEAQLRR
jgi:7-alpha-hydroxysteroid dehydrogenase